MKNKETIDGVTKEVIKDVTDQNLFSCDQVVQAWSVTHYFTSGEVETYVALYDDGHYELHDHEGDEATGKLILKAVKRWEANRRTSSN